MSFWKNLFKHWGEKLNRFNNAKKDSYGMTALVKVRFRQLNSYDNVNLKI
jgi:hypothetical protein